MLASVADKLLPIPINRTTLNGLYGLDLQDDEAAAAFLAGARRAACGNPHSRGMSWFRRSARDLYRTFFEGYTRKQWGLDPSELDKSVTARIPTRTSTDDRYFLDTYQAMPADGFTRLFENMLDHPNIRVETGVDHRDFVARSLRRARSSPGRSTRFSTTASGLCLIAASSSGTKRWMWNSSSRSRWSTIRPRTSPIRGSPNTST